MFVTVEQVIGTLIVHFSRAMAVRVAPANLEPRSLPQVGNRIGFIPAEGIAIAIEHFDRVFYLVRAAGIVEAVTAGK